MLGSKLAPGPIMSHPEDSFVDLHAELCATGTGPPEDAD
jgi:hypothetical protein